MRRFRERLPGRHIASDAEALAQPQAFRYAAVWKPAPGVARPFSRSLEVIFNLGAGVDALLKDPTLPRVPLVRVVNGDLTRRMTEYVVLHCLMYHRRQRMLDAGPGRGQLAGQGPVAGVGGARRSSGPGRAWPRRGRGLAAHWFPGVRLEPDSQVGFRRPVFAGAAELPRFLAGTDILVVLVPLDSGDGRHAGSPALRGSRPRRGAGCPRGHQCRSRWSCRSRPTSSRAWTMAPWAQPPSTCSGRSPCRRDSPFWRHPKVTITPHNAADSDPDAISDYIVAQIQAYEAGQAPAQHRRPATGATERAGVASPPPRDCPMSR